MDEKASPGSFQSGDFALTPSRVLELDNEGLDQRLFTSEEENDLDFDADEQQNLFDETAVLNHNLLHNRGSMAREPSNRTVSSISSFGEIPMTNFGLEKTVSGRSFNSSSKSVDAADDISHGISINPRTSRNLQKDTSGRSFMDRSPRARRRAAMSLSKRNLIGSTHEEEAAALAELKVIVGEENRDKVEIKKNPAGFIYYLAIADADIDGTHARIA